MSVGIVWFFYLFIIYLFIYFLRILSILTHTERGKNILKKNLQLNSQIYHILIA